MWWNTEVGLCWWTSTSPAILLKVKQNRGTQEVLRKSAPIKSASPRSTINLVKVQPLLLNLWAAGGGADCSREIVFPRQEPTAWTSYLSVQSEVTGNYFAQLVRDSILIYSAVVVNNTQCQQSFSVQLGLVITILAQVARCVTGTQLTSEFSVLRNF